MHWWLYRWILCLLHPIHHLQKRQSLGFVILRCLLTPMRNPVSRSIVCPISSAWHHIYCELWNAWLRQIEIIHLTTASWSISFSASTSTRICMALNVYSIWGSWFGAALKPPTVDLRRQLYCGFNQAPSHLIRKILSDWYDILWMRCTHHLCDNSSSQNQLSLAAAGHPAAQVNAVPLIPNRHHLNSNIR